MLSMLFRQYPGFQEVPGSAESERRCQLSFPFPDSRGPADPGAKRRLCRLPERVPLLISVPGILEQSIQQHVPLGPMKILHGFFRLLLCEMSMMRNSYASSCKMIATPLLIDLSLCSWIGLNLSCS